MARYSSFLGRRVEVQYRAGDVLLPASGTFVADSGRSIFLEQNFEQRGQHKHFRGKFPTSIWCASRKNRIPAPLQMVVPLGPLRKPHSKHLSRLNSAMSRLAPLLPLGLAERLVSCRSPAARRLPERFSDRHLSLSWSRFGYNRLLILSRIRARCASAAAEEAPLETCHWVDRSRAHGTAHGNESLESRLFFDCLESYRFAR